MKEFDNISVPKNIKEVTIKAVDRGENHKVKKKKNRKRFIAASIIGFLLIGGSINSRAVSAAIEKITNRFESFYNKNYDASLKPNTLEGFKTVVGTTVEDKGVKITLNEFYMDDKEIYINTNEDCRNVNEYSRGQDANIYINGKKINARSSVANFIHNKNKTIDILSVYEVEGLDLSKVEDVKISYNEFEFEPKTVDKDGKEMGPITTQEQADKMEEMLKSKEWKELKPNVISGNWEFNFKYDGKKIASQIKNIKVNREFLINGVKFNVASVKITPAKIVVYYQDDETTNRGELRKYIRFGVKDKEGKIIHDAGGTQRSKEIGNSNIDIMINIEDVNNLEILPSVTKDYDKPIYSEKDSIKVDYSK